MARRYDGTKIDSIGAKEFTFTAMKTGVYSYFDWEDMKIHKELKHPDDWLKPEVISQLKYLPITDTHPRVDTGLLDGDNKSTYTKGICLDAVKVGNDSFDGSAVIYDGKLLDKIKLDNQVECSLGFECTVLDEIGSFDGQPYDRRQVLPILNHLAIVSDGRCGSSAALHLDSEDKGFAIRVDSDFSIDIIKKHKEELPMKSIKIDGIDCEVTEIVAAKFDSLTGTIDGLTVQLAEAKKSVVTESDLKVKIDSAVTGLISTYETAKDLLPEGYSIVGKDSKQIKIDAIMSVDKSFVAEGKSEDYLTGRFDSMIQPKIVDATKVKVETKTDAKETAKLARLTMFTQEVK